MLYIQYNIIYTDTYIKYAQCIYIYIQCVYTYKHRIYTSYIYHSLRGLAEAPRTAASRGGL